jgi:hypothetical protein
MEALNPGTGHDDAVQRCPPPLRTTRNAGLIPALCERHDDTSSADRYWLTVLTEPDRGRSDTPRTTLMAKPLITPGAARHAWPRLTTPLPCPAAALEANDLGGWVPEHPGPRHPQQSRVPERRCGLHLQYEEEQRNAPTVHDGQIYSVAFSTDGNLESALAQGLAAAGFMPNAVMAQVSPPEARVCGASVGPGEARTGSAIAPGAES